MADKVKHILVENNIGSTEYDIYDENAYEEINKVDTKIANLNDKIGSENIGNKTVTKAIKDLQETVIQSGVKTVDKIQPDIDGDISLSDKYLEKSHKEVKADALNIGHVVLTDELPAGAASPSTNGVQTGTAASGYIVQKVREDLTSKINEVSAKIPTSVGTVKLVNEQQPNQAGAVTITGSDIEYKKFTAGENHRTIADKFESLDITLQDLKPVTPITELDKEKSYIDIKGLTIGEDNNYKIDSGVKANPSISSSASKLNSITIDGVDYNIEGSGSSGGQIIQVYELPEAGVDYKDVIYQYIGETTDDYKNGYFYKCITEKNKTTYYYYYYTAGSYKMGFTIKENSKAEDYAYNCNEARWGMEEVPSQIIGNGSTYPAMFIKEDYINGQQELTITQRMGSYPESEVASIYDESKNEYYEGTEIYVWKAIPVQAGGSSGGTDDYTDLENKPKIAGVTLIGDKTLAELGINNFDGNYNNLDNIPSEFTPTEHNHTINEIVDLDLTTKVNVAQGAVNKGKILKVNASGDLALTDEEGGGMSAEVEGKTLKFTSGGSGGGGGSTSHTYSTEEQIVGTWLDGKPVYEVTQEYIDISSTTQDLSLSHNIANIDKLISCEGYRLSYSDSSTIAPLSDTPWSATSYIMIGAINRTNISIKLGSGRKNTALSYRFIIRYTKITD